MPQFLSVSRTRIYTWQNYTKIGHFQGELIFLQDLEPGTRSPCAILEPSSSSVHPLILYWHLLRTLHSQQKSTWVSTYEKIIPHWEMLPNSAKKLVVRNGGILYGPKKATFLDGSRFMGSHPSIHTTSWAMSLALTVVNLPFKGRFFLGEEPSRPWVYVHMTHNIWPCFVIAWTKESSLFYILGHFASREFIVFISKDAFYLFRADSPKSATESPVAHEIENSNSKNHPGSSVILEN